ncbi:MAG TPA: hypothetical protein VFB93_04215 [Burkholderiales bacterium]|nr:hypothetical protein [Burkholderiales bacterium]
MLLPPKYYVSNSLINVRNCRFIMKIADRLVALRGFENDAGVICWQAKLQRLISSTRGLASLHESVRKCARGLGLSDAARLLGCSAARLRGRIDCAEERYRVRGESLGAAAGTPVGREMLRVEVMRGGPIRCRHGGGGPIASVTPRAARGWAIPRPAGARHAQRGSEHRDGRERRGDLLDMLVLASLT